MANGLEEMRGEKADDQQKRIDVVVRPERETVKVVAWLGRCLIAKTWLGQSHRWPIVAAMTCLGEMLPAAALYYAVRETGQGSGGGDEILHVQGASLQYMLCTTPYQLNR